jgi:hypothetical protein
LAQTGEIGIIEDVMNSIKLLPGVGYTGFFNAQPSIRGGDPWDMNAALNGFYIFHPYHWGGGFSIFDPRMVESAKLSHGVFSARYGHTISGLLEITSKRPSSEETGFELSVNSSAANFSLSFPFSGNGGLLMMGRITYYDPVIWLIKQAAKTIESLEPVNIIRQAPYIRSMTVTGNYRFSGDLELQATGFFGMDGVGVNYESSIRNQGEFDSDTKMDFEWTNYQGFITTGLLWNPRSDMLLKFSVGTGYEEVRIDGDIQFDISGKKLSEGFKDKVTGEFNWLSVYFPDIDDSYNFGEVNSIHESEFLYNAQGRIDYDWELGKGFLFSAGFQEMFSLFKASGKDQLLAEKWLMDFDDQEQLLKNIGFPDPIISSILDSDWDILIGFPVSYSPDVGNRLFTTSGYGLLEYTSPNNRFSTELGLRVDHFYMTGKGFSLQSKPALNPRLNLDFNLFEGNGFLRSIGLSAGTGLFSSMNQLISYAEEKLLSYLEEIKPNRSWTSVLGTQWELANGFSFNIEAYYKYVFDRMYLPIDFAVEGIDLRPHFNGEGRVWGIDLMLQKLQSRYWDGWLSYSFLWAKNRDPDGILTDFDISGGSRGDDWYFPPYHRFHNLNLVLNFKPIPRINIYTRFGFASGAQLRRRIGDGPKSYPVYLYYGDSHTDNKFIEKYYWNSVWDENNRTTPSLPMDIKFSLFGGSEKGKARYELYVAVENVLSLLYTAQGNETFNQYTGQVDQGSNTAYYDLPVPIPSFGFKISY